MERTELEKIRKTRMFNGDKLSRGANKQGQEYNRYSISHLLVYNIMVYHSTTKNDCIYIYLHKKCLRMKYICAKHLTNEMDVFSLVRTTSISGIMTALKLTSTTDRFWRNRYMGTWRVCSKVMMTIMMAFPIRVTR